MEGAGAVTALVLLEWAAGWVAVAAWSQSWGVVGRGHFRITAWGALGFGVLAWLANRAATEGVDADTQRGLVTAVVVLLAAYLAVQYSRTDLPGVVVGAAAGVTGVAALIASVPFIDGWGPALAAANLIASAAFLGGVTNGMLLGHWYLNQPGLKTWALWRLTVLTLVATGAVGLAGLLGAGALASASTEGALGLPGASDSFGAAFFAIWIALVVFTGVIVWMTKRCVDIRSIQSATGLYYVSLLTAGVAAFLVRYLMLGAT